MSIGAFFTVYTMATVKILFAVAAGAGLNLVGWKLSVTIFAGGMTGIVFFALAGSGIRKWFAKRRERRGKKPSFSKAKKVLKIYKKFGLVGLAILTPPLLSPPVGPTLAIAFGERFGRVVLYMGISLAAWSVIFGLFATQIRNLIGAH